LCGDDFVTGKNFDHRRDWLTKRMCLLTTCFAIDIYAYAFMKNHYHIVLFVDPERVNDWSDEQIIEKWKTLWNWRQPDRPLVLPKNVSPSEIAKWRNRLADISWVMRLLNEPLARLANAEDNTKGHFWESRFKCNPLLDDGALVACMVYADLNPIKAGVARRAEDSDYTSIQQRIRNLSEDVSTNQCDTEQRNSNTKRIELKPVAGSGRTGVTGPAISSNEYIELVKSTAHDLQQQCQSVSREVLISLGLKPSGWLCSMGNFLTVFRTAIGSDSAFREFMVSTQRSRRQDVVARERLFS